MVGVGATGLGWVTVAGLGLFSWLIYIHHQERARRAIRRQWQAWEAQFDQEDTEWLST